MIRPADKIRKILRLAAQTEGPEADVARARARALMAEYNVSAAEASIYLEQVSRPVPSTLTAFGVPNWVMEAATWAIRGTGVQAVIAYLEGSPILYFEGVIAELSKAVARYDALFTQVVVAAAVTCDAELRVLRPSRFGDGDPYAMVSYSDASTPPPAPPQQPTIAPAVHIAWYEAFCGIAVSKVAAVGKKRAEEPPPAPPSRRQTDERERLNDIIQEGCKEGFDVTQVVPVAEAFAQTFITRERERLQRRLPARSVFSGDGAVQLRSARLRLAVIL